MSVKLHSRKWTDAYATPGQVVECRWGITWERCVIVSRTKSGLPIVALFGDRTPYTFRIDRKGDIRALSGEPLPAPEREQSKEGT